MTSFTTSATTSPSVMLSMQQGSNQSTTLQPNTIDQSSSIALLDNSYHRTIYFAGRFT